MNLAIGNHVLLELYGCNSDKIKVANEVEFGMLQAAKVANATTVSSKFHEFSPYGVSGVIILAESHLTIHTWPEHNYAAVDLFTCGDTVDSYTAIEYLKQFFEATQSSTIEMKRGYVSDIKLNKQESPKHTSRGKTIENTSEISI